MPQELHIREVRSKHVTGLPEPSHPGASKASVIRRVATENPGLSLAGIVNCCLRDKGVVVERDYVRRVLREAAANGTAPARAPGPCHAIEILERLARLLPPGVSFFDWERLVIDAGGWDSLRRIHRYTLAIADAELRAAQPPPPADAA